MIKKITSFFKEMKQSIERGNFLGQMNRKDIAFMRDHIEPWMETQNAWFKKFESTQAALVKKFSSIEMEMLMSRGASLDNNFEGKEDM